MAEDLNGTVWVKQGYLLGEVDHVTGQPKADAIPPGIYCADADTHKRFTTDPRIEALKTEKMGVPFRGAAPFFGLGGVAVTVATPEQIAWFQAKEAEKDGGVH